MFFASCFPWEHYYGNSEGIHTLSLLRSPFLDITLFDLRCFPMRQCQYYLHLQDDRQGPRSGILCSRSQLFHLQMIGTKVACSVVWCLATLSRWQSLSFLWWCLLGCSQGPMLGSYENCCRVSLSEIHTVHAAWEMWNFLVVAVRKKIAIKREAKLILGFM